MQKDDIDVKDLTFINNIKSMAVIGPSEKRGYFFLRNHQESFKGDLYAIHPTVKHIEDFPDENIFPSVKDVPGVVEFAFIAVPPNQILRVMDDCYEKGVKLVTVFTANFADAGNHEGEELERKLLKRAGDKVRILGPNGMGLFYPKLGIAWRAKFPSKKGNIGFIGQSGGICNIAIYMAKEYGLDFSKVFSFGNGADIDFVDLLNFLSNDPETDLILCYLEGIKENRMHDLRKVLSRNSKPIIVLKGGKTKTGSVAAKSHTASISGNNKLWNAFFKQYNMVEVNSLEHLLNAARMIQCYGVCDIENIAVFSISGGYGVVMVDLIENSGLKVPQFTSETQKKLREKFYALGTSSLNPLDVAAQFFNTKWTKEIMEIAISDKNIDALIMDIPSWYFNIEYFFTPDPDFEKNIYAAFELGHKYKKPLILIIQRAHCPESHTEVSRRLIEKKVPVYGDPQEIIPLLNKISRLNNSKI